MHIDVQPWQALLYGVILLVVCSIASCVVVQVFIVRTLRKRPSLIRLKDDKLSDEIIALKSNLSLINALGPVIVILLAIFGVKGLNEISALGPAEITKAETRMNAAASQFDDKSKAADALIERLQTGNRYVEKVDLKEFEPRSDIDSRLTRYALGDEVRRVDSHCDEALKSLQNDHTRDQARLADDLTKSAAQLAATETHDRDLLRSDLEDTKKTLSQGITQVGAHADVLDGQLRAAVLTMRSDSTAFKNGIAQALANSTLAINSFTEAQSRITDLSSETNKLRIGSQRVATTLDQLRQETSSLQVAIKPLLDHTSTDSSSKPGSAKGQ